MDELTKVFEDALKTILRELRAKRPSTPFYHDEDGEVDDDKYQEALEAQWDREDSHIDEDIDEIEDMLGGGKRRDEEWLMESLAIINRHGYNVIISKNF